MFMSKNNTKRSLLASVFALVLCVAMLVGSTFAWFTDTATTGVNKIVSGNLKVDIVGENSDTHVEKLKFTKAGTTDAEASAEILWEPGCRYLTEGFRIANQGNLALKWKAQVNKGTTATNENNVDLLDVIDFYLVTKTADGTETETALDEFTGNLKKAETSDVYYIKGVMQTTAGNDYQGLTLNGITITVYATQDTVENDSFGNDYDANATYPTYPLGVTKDSFTGTQKAVDDQGNFYPSFKEAMENVADGGALYFKEDSVVNFPTHLNVTKNVTIYGNGADFSGKDISIGTYVAPENAETTVNIYDAKNLVVWGQPVGTRQDVWNVNFYNCTNDGYNFLMYRGSETGTAKLNLTLTNCSATGFGDSIIHTTADGSIIIQNCTFRDNCAPVNIAHKQAGTMNVTVEKSRFIGCGKVDPSNDYFAPVRFVNNSATGTLTVNLKNNTFTGTIGTNGDILLGDYRDGKPSHALTANITTDKPVMVKSSAEAAYSYNGGIITLN